MTLTHLADTLSNGINPIFVALILEEPLLPPRRAQEPWWLFWLRSAVSIAIAVVLAEMGKRYVVWSGHPSFPSGHTTLATASATCLVRRRGAKWLFLVAPLVCLMGVSLVYAGWHTPVDIAGGLALGMGIPALIGFFRLNGKELQ